MIDIILLEQIKSRFSEIIGESIAEIIFKNLFINLDNKNNVLSITVDSLSNVLLTNNESQYLNILWEIIKEEINKQQLHNWNNWNFKVILVDSNEKKMQEKNLFFSNYNSTNLDKFLTFENYFSKNDNMQIINSCHYILDTLEEEHRQITTFYIYAKSGYGKTHIINALGNAIFEKDNHLKILYITGNTFLEDYTNSFKGFDNNILKFEEKYKNLDVLIIDDFQVLASKEQTLNAFFEIFDKMRTQNKIIVLASDEELNNLAMPDRIISRIKDGSLNTINKPDKDTRARIFKYHFNLNFNKCEIEESAVELVCETFSSPREIIGFTKTLMLHVVTSINNSTRQIITLDDVQNILNNMYQAKNISKKDIVECVCNKFKVDEKDVLKKNTRGIHRSAGNFIIYFLSKKLCWEQIRISKLFGLTDHSAISKRLKSFENEDKIKYKDIYTQISCELNRKYDD